MSLQWESARTFLGVDFRNSTVHPYPRESLILCKDTNLKQRTLISDRVIVPPIVMQCANTNGTFCCECECSHRTQAS